MNRRRKQTVVIELLFLEGEIAANIPRRFVNGYGKAALGVCTVRRLVGRDNNNPREKVGSEFSDGCSNGKPAAAVN